ncbi:type II toxin-antitoxin system ParD family antitoxin [Oscillatoria sp. CS-180]|uniref:type II toxin-antitoxin system ParD family antitoxin n=1 Tax=Oscillatoria sp. CS-180 TaxID=3021720 RepID=UPI003FA71490
MVSGNNPWFEPTSENQRQEKLPFSGRHASVSQQLIQRQIATGKYQSALEVITAGLHLIGQFSIQVLTKMVESGVTAHDLRHSAKL